MSNITIGVLGMIVLVVLIFSGVHVGICLGVVGVGGLLILVGLPKTITLVSTAAFYYTNTSTLIVMPCFMLMSCLAAEVGLADAAFGSLSKLIGRIPAGLGIANNCATTLFGMVTGSAASTTTTFTKISVPILRKHGYEKKFAYGMVAASGLTGMLIPPSVLIVFWGLNTGESIGSLLMAGIGPGLLLNFLFCACAFIMVIMKPSLAPVDKTKYPAKEKLLAVVDLWPILVVGFIIIGGMYGGIFTATEAGAWGVVAVVIIGFITKKMSIKVFWNACLETVGVMSMMYLILICGQVFARFLTLSGLSQAIVTYIANNVSSTTALLIGLVLLYLVLGCFLDSMAIVGLTVPIVYPIIVAMKIDPIWFAMVAILALHAGMLTPPLGICVYSGAAVAEPDVKLWDIFSGAMPFLAMVILATIITIFVPQIATYIPLHVR